MIFRKSLLCFFLAIILFSQFGVNRISAEIGNSDNYLYQGFPIESRSVFSPPVLSGTARPLLFPSDFFSQSTRKRLQVNKGKIKNTVAGIVKYDKNGWPKFDSIFTARLPGNMLTDPQLASETDPIKAKRMEDKLRQKHLKEANAQLRDHLKRDPSLRGKFTREQIQQIESGKTPQDYTWHHNEKGQLELVKTEQHKRVGHVGGVAKYAKLNSRVIIRTTSIRWGKIAIADLVFSVGYSCINQHLDWEEIMKTTSAISGAWISATTVESLMNIVPTKLPFKFLPSLTMFQPATYIATITYVATRVMISHLWEEHEIEQARQVEKLCSIAENKARWSKFQKEVMHNNDLLNELAVVILQD